MKNLGTQRTRWVWSSFLTCLMIVTVSICPAAFAQPVQGGTLDPTTIPKYETPLVIPPVMLKSTASPAPAADYDIAVRQFQQQVLPGGIWGSSFPNPKGGAPLGPFPATKIWSYGRAEDPRPDSSGIAGGALGVAPAPNSSFNYPAFTVENTTGVTTKVRWINGLVDDVPGSPTLGNYLPHLFAVDQTMHWANPPQANCTMGNPNRTDCETAIAAPYTGPVPLVTHVHGAHVQSHSDGYPEAWWLPAANNIPAGYALKGSRYGQADNTNAAPGSAYFSYENTQPAATIWYHDHALGMTRLNVVAGPAGFWLIRGGAYDTAPGVLPGPAPTLAGGDPNFNPTVRATIREIPIVIQDRSFNTDGSLFYPDSRFFFDNFTGPFIGNSGFTGPYTPGATPLGPSDISGIWNPEAFFNTMVVNGVTWPKFDVTPARYRLRFLDGCNSRTLNLWMREVTGPGTDGVYGTTDDVIGAEVPFYLIGGDQGFLPKVVKITKGSATPLPGDGTTPPPFPAPSPEQGLLMGPAERADVIVDFSGMAAGTRVRIFNSGPDSPFQGFPGNLALYFPSDPGTTGQVMDFIVSGTALPSDATTTAPQNLVLPAAPALGTATSTRQVSLNEMSSDQVCVEVNATTGAIVGTLFSVPPGTATFLADCAATPVAAGNLAQPMGPRQALLGSLTVSGGNLVAVPQRWGNAITETPLLNDTETWEIYNTTADAHPVHLHLVAFEVVNRQDLDPVALPLGNLIANGTVYQAQPHEQGYKDTVIALPGQVTRLKARFDIAGLYLWHCHILEHEDNEMMRAYTVSTDLLYANFTGTQNGLWQWNQGSWNQLTASVPTSIAASGSTLYADFDGFGLWKWDSGKTWTQLSAADPIVMTASGSNLYVALSSYGLFKWDGTTLTQINQTTPTIMAVSGSLLYAGFTGYGLYQWNGTTWSQVSSSVPTIMAVSGATLYAAFPSYGLYKWDGTALTQVNETTPTTLAVSGSALYAGFADYGFYKWDGTAWTQISQTAPTSLAATATSAYAALSPYGLYQWDGATLTQINQTTPSALQISGSILYADFEDYGLYRWDGTAWSQMNSTSPTSITSGF